MVRGRSSGSRKLQRPGTDFGGSLSHALVRGQSASAPEEVQPRRQELSMGRLIIIEFITLDGVVDSPGGGPQPRAGWTFQQVAFGEAAYEIKDREQQEAAAMLLGRVSYDEFAPVWPVREEFARYNAMPKYVVSSTPENPQWNNTSVPCSLAEVARLKDALDGNILVHGSTTLAQGLAAAGFVDRYHRVMFPVLLGRGLRLSDDTTDALRALALVEHEACSNGVIKAVYDVARRRIPAATPRRGTRCAGVARSRAARTGSCRAVGAPPPGHAARP